MQNELPIGDGYYTNRYAALREYVVQCSSFHRTFGSTLPVKSGTDQRLLDLEKFLSYFQGWHDSCNATASNARRSEFIPHNQCFYDIKLTVAATCTFIRHTSAAFPGSYICLSKLNQDCCDTTSSTCGRILGLGQTAALVNAPQARG